MPINPVSLKRRDDVAVITIDNPPVNALSQAVREGLVARIEEAESDPAVGAIVIICAGRTFVAGADIKEFNKPPQPPHLPDLVNRIEAVARPVVAAIHGTALGGGLELALGCHYRVARTDAAVGFPEVNLGLLPGATGTQRLPRLTGVEKALEIMVGGKPVAAARAHELGIIDVLADGSDNETLLEAAISHARQMAASGAPPRRVSELEVEPPPAGFFDEYRERIARRTRGLMAPERIIRCVEGALRLPWDQAIALERELFMECKASEQSAALRHAFFAERRCWKVPRLGKETPVREIGTVGVIGAGTMGAGIAYACLGAGLRVVLIDNDDQALERGEQTITGLYDGGIKRGKTTDKHKADGLARLTTTRDYQALADADLVIEAVFENLAIKKEVFARLDAACRDGAILATNTSTLNVDAIAAATGRPSDVIGLHFFSPAHLMKLLEIVRGSETSDDVIATSQALARRLGKIGVVVGNCHGFVGNRMLYSYGRENQLLLLEGAAPEHIDRVLYDWGMAMGPNAVGDLAGLDVGYKARRERSDLPDDPRYFRIADVLAEMGRYGRKTGKGMFLYPEGGGAPVPDPEVQELIRREAAALGIEQREVGEQEIIERCIYGLIVEGARILEEGIAIRASDIDVVWINGYGFPRHRGGPMYYADSIGLDAVFDTVCEFRDRFGPQYWEPPALLERLAESGRGFADLEDGGS